MPILITPERGGQNIRKGNSPKLDETQGFQYLGHSNGTIRSLLSWFCSQIFPSSNHASHNKPTMPILITPERGRQNIRKGNSPKLDETQGLQCRGHSKWTICSLLSWFCSQIFPSSNHASHNKPNMPILITPERGRKNIRKGNSPKLDETQGFQYLGHSNRTFRSLLSWFCSQIFPSSYQPGKLILQQQTHQTRVSPKSSTMTFLLHSALLLAPVPEVSHHEQ